MNPLSFPHATERHPHVWPWLLAGLAITTVLPIGIHTVMLDELGVPYPSAFPRSGWPSIPDNALIVLGAFVLNAMVARGPVEMSGVGRFVFLFLAIVTINQALFRLPVMRNVVSTKWTIYPFIDNAPVVLQFAVVAVLVCCIGPVATTATRKIVAAILVALIAFAGARSVLDRIFAQIIAGDGAREGSQLYTVPYDWHVDVPSYLTYVEPVFGAFAVATILAQRRTRWPIIATIVFALQGGPLFRLVLNPFYAPSGPWVAVLSEAQFSLEAMALAMLVALISTALLRPISHRGPR